MSPSQMKSTWARVDLQILDSRRNPDSDIFALSLVAELRHEHRIWENLSIATNSAQGFPWKHEQRYVVNPHINKSTAPETLETGQAAKLPNAAFHAERGRLERMARFTILCDSSIGVGEVGNVVPMVYIHHQFKGTRKPSSNPVVPPDPPSCSDPLIAF